MIAAPLIADAFRAACADEIAAPKPGNVHVHAAGHGMTVTDFLRSAEAAAPALCAPGAGLGARVLGAVRATRRAVGQNTNLGILLLCAPLTMAAETGGDLRAQATRVVERAGIADAEAVFQAIALAAPGGLGTAPRHDVRAPATVPLSVAMTEAAGRDRIARQYVSGFADVFGGAMDAYAAALARWSDRATATLAAYLHHLAAAPDSHVLRKHGAAEAARVQQEAQGLGTRLAACADPAAMLPELLAWDAALKRRGVNPGTSADLAVATGFAARIGSVTAISVESGPASQ